MKGNNKLCGLFKHAARPFDAAIIGAIGLCILLALASWKSNDLIDGAAEKGISWALQPVSMIGGNIRHDNDTPLRLAAASGQTEAVVRLLHMGADVHSWNDFALLKAAENGHASTVKVLLDHGGNVHARDGAALKLAAFRGHLATVRVLVEAGAGVTKDALSLAKEEGHQDTVRFLRDYLSRSAAVARPVLPVLQVQTLV